MANPSRLQPLLPAHAEIWAIAWPRPSDRCRPLVILITALGAEGAWLQANQRLPVGMTVELCFALPDVDVEIVCGAVVCDVSTWGRITVAFTLVECHDAEQLNAWVVDRERTDQRAAS